MTLLRNFASGAVALAFAAPAANAQPEEITVAYL